MQQVFLYDDSIRLTRIFMFLVLSDVNKRFLYDVGVYNSDDDDDEDVSCNCISLPLLSKAHLSFLVVFSFMNQILVLQQ